MQRERFHDLVTLGLTRFRDLVTLGLTIPDKLRNSNHDIEGLVTDGQRVGWTNVVTTGIKPSSNISSALVSAMCGRSSELGLYLWGNRPLPTVQEHPLLVSGGWLPYGG